MPHLTSNTRSTTVAATLALVLLGLLLSACGAASTSSTKSATASASATPSSSANGSSGSGGGSTTGGSGAQTPGGAGAPAPGGGSLPRDARFSKVRECLAKNGVTLPKRNRALHPTGGFLGNGAPQLPKGVTRAQYGAALRKCGATPRAGRLKAFAARPQAKEALDRFAACMRERGVNLPTPNTSGKGPIFNTSGLNVSGTKFKAAETKCAPELRGAFGARRDHQATPNGGPGGVAPPAGG